MVDFVGSIELAGVHGEFIKSRGDRRLVKAATVLPPPIRDKAYRLFAFVDARFWLCFANTRFSDLWISKHKALSKFVKESVAEDQSVGAGSGTEGPGIQDVPRALLATTPPSSGYRSAPSPYLSSDAFVAMMQSADFSDLNDPAGL
jgi:hypothetical protein